MHEDGTYEGTIQDGQWHGQGTLTHADRTTLRGRFVRGRLFRGQGTLKMPSGDVYDGEIRSYKRLGMRAAAAKAVGPQKSPGPGPGPRPQIFSGPRPEEY